MLWGRAEEVIHGYHELIPSGDYTDYEKLSFIIAALPTSAVFPDVVIAATLKMGPLVWNLPSSPITKPSMVKAWREKFPEHYAGVVTFMRDYKQVPDKLKESDEWLCIVALADAICCATESGEIDKGRVLTSEEVDTLLVSWVESKGGVVQPLGGSYMIYAIVGRAYSGKAEVAKQISKFFDGRVRRLPNFTTKPVTVNQRHVHVSAEWRSQVRDKDIFYSVTNACGEEFLYLRSQFTKDKDVSYVVDDPTGLENLDSLCIPYAVIYVHCADKEVMRRARTRRDNLVSVTQRAGEVSVDLEEFRKSGRYSMYLDTSRLTMEMQNSAIKLFCIASRAWASNHSKNSKHMMNVSYKAGKGWFKKMCKAGVSVQGGSYNGGSLDLSQLGVARKSGLDINGRVAGKDNRRYMGHDINGSPVYS